MARAVSRAVQHLGSSERFCDGLEREEPFIEQELFFSDGQTAYFANVVRTIELSRPLLVFEANDPQAANPLTVCSRTEWDALTRLPVEPMAHKPVVLSAL